MSAERAPGASSREGTAARRASSRPRVRLVHPHHTDAEEFVAAARRSRALHASWVAPPRDREAFDAWIEARRGPRHASFLARDLEDDGLVGYFGLSEIVRGPMQSAYLGFYAFAPLAGRGLMTEALSQVLRRAFVELGLHRVEANIQPANERSRALVERCGFTLEGYSPRYLKIAGRWRDHERWAVVRDDWKTRRRR
ncbi:MAG: GNAT family N-acetyltransferase [Planctomycetes bacterium]|nr:GNAT family N-acetyltransferase [Planctomycetota bacterium]